jgi:RNA polymerase sigma-70 factor (ECF subfamily)
MDTQASDGDLLWRTAQGDEAAFTALYRRRQGPVYRFALHMSGSPAVAEDVTQEVFLELMRDPAGYDPERGPLASYLYGMTRNLVLRALRTRPEGPPEAAAPDLVEDLARRDAIAAVRRAVLTLPPRYREVVVLCDLEEMNYAEAAVALGCAVGTVRSRLHRARALLAGKLGARPARTEPGNPVPLRYKS